jgi:hypothetical protein
MKAEVGVALSGDLFQFNTPEGYGIVDRRFKTPLVISPHERELPRNSVEQLAGGAQSTGKMDTVGGAQQVAMPGGSGMISPSNATATPSTCRNIGTYAWVIGIVIAGGIAVFIVVWHRRRTGQLPRQD